MQVPAIQRRVQRDAQGPPPGVVAYVTEQGVLLHADRLTGRLGGNAGWRRVLNSLTITEKAHAGRQRGMGMKRQHAYEIVRGLALDGHPPSTWLRIPRCRLAPLLAAGAVDAPPRVLDPPREPRALSAAACTLRADQPLWPYQEAIVARITTQELGPEARAAFRGQAYLKLGTGEGKTRIGAAMVARLGMPAIIAVPSSGAIAKQWIDEFAEAFPGMRVAKYENSARNPPTADTHDVVIVVVNTLCKKTPEFVRGFGLIVFDEAHEFHSPVHGRSLWLAQTPAVLGLSATPDERPDGLDRYVFFHLGPPLDARAFPGVDISDATFRGEVLVVEYEGHPDHCETVMGANGTASAPLTIGKICGNAEAGWPGDPHRPRLIAALIHRYSRLHETAPLLERVRLGLGARPPSAATPKHPAGEVRRHGIFVFAETRDYLVTLREALLERFRADEVCAPELDARDEAALDALWEALGEEDPAPAPAGGGVVSMLRGGVAHDEQARIRARRPPVVVTTYGYSRRGISLPYMTCELLATPRRNGSTQILGRITRRGSDESIVRQVIDIVDVRTGLRGQVQERKKAYKAKGWAVTTVRARWSDYPLAAAAAAAAAPADPVLELVEGGDDEDAFADCTDEELVALALGAGPAD